MLILRRIAARAPLVTDARERLRDRVAELRRETILDAAVEVFAAKGFGHASVRDVARAAGIADGTLYNYFRSKDELLLALLDRLNESERRPADLAGASDLEGFLPGYLRHRLDLLAADRDLLRALLPELLSNADLRERYRREVVAPTMVLGEQALAAGSVDDPELTARLLAGTVLGVALLDLLGLLDDELEAVREGRVAERLAELLLHGLIAPKGGGS
jgi:TetR/AcrR family fatty acid metabolism transcriptional regulator